jgi:anti-sigma B factor antagonist
MKIREAIHQKVAVLSLRGNLMGPPESTKLYEHVSNLIDDGISRIALDLQHVSWINSLGVGAIMQCFKALNEVDGHLRLVGLTEKVHSIFMMTQLTKVLMINTSVDEAIQELNQT